MELANYRCPKCLANNVSEPIIKESNSAIVECSICLSRYKGKYTNRGFVILAKNGQRLYEVIDLQSNPNGQIEAQIKEFDSGGSRAKWIKSYYLDFHAPARC